MFQDSEIILREKNFSDFQNNRQSESRYCNAIPKAETPLYMKSEKADSPSSDRMERGLELVCLIAMRECQSRGTVYWGRRSVGQNFVGLDVTGAKSLGQNVVGQDVTGA